MTPINGITFYCKKKKKSKHFYMTSFNMTYVGISLEHTPTLNTEQQAIAQAIWTIRLCLMKGAS